MNRLQRYWRLWRTLPPDERREHASRVVERLARRRPAIRRLGLVPDQPRWGELGRALRIDRRQLAERLRTADGRRGPLFGPLDSRAKAVAATHPRHADAVVEQAGRILDGRFDLLGSGPSQPLRDDGGIDWHLDWKSGGRWPEGVYYTDLVVVRGDGSDVKLPWELARCQHLLVLAQAWQLAPCRRPRNEAAELRVRCAGAFRSQIDDWIRQNPRGLGVHWSCAMEVGIRAFVWLACLGMLREAPELDDDFLSRLVRSLWVHGRQIRRNLEIGAGGLTSNHFLSNVIGLYTLGCALPELHEAGGWRQWARDALAEEMDKQVHPDGVNYERSIPYHRLVGEIFAHGLLLARAAGDELPASYLERLGKMLEFTASCTRPDGTVPQWGDNDDGRLLPLDGYATTQPNDHRHLLALGGALLEREALRAAGGGREVETLWLTDAAAREGHAAPAGRESRAFPDARFYVMRHADLHAAIGCGPVGTLGVGNHSHNDLFSLCVWAGGVEWIPDPGTGNYTGDPNLRNRLRSTAAHATLQLGEREQNAFGTELDDVFRLHERARPQVHAWSVSPGGAELTASHEGFSRDGERWRHERSVRFSARARSWQIHDHLRREAPGEGDDEATGEPVFLRFPLLPETTARTIPDRADWPEPLRAALEPARAEGRDGFAVCLASGDARFWIGLDLPGGSRIDQAASVHSPRYGVAVPSRCLTATLPGAPELRATTLLWAPANKDPA